MFKFHHQKGGIACYRSAQSPLSYPRPST